MSFKLGDSVLVIDDDLSGVIKQISGNTMTIETADGFLLDFKSDELIANKTGYAFTKDLFSKATIKDIVSEKEQPSKRRQIKTKAKDRYEPTMEIDLHINKLVKSSKGMSKYDIQTLQLDTARRQLDFAIAKRIQKMVFIHGVGEGILKVELEYLFGRYDNIKFYEANYQKYGLGATEVYIYQSAKPD
ncbi:DNA mismatch repair protein MutS [Flavivirga aquimarina]|uniref:DNA mismatch repair protein MutS n=1 Tax=Flavivirga aquimarina TaxID=2027862 RepID=A0ABT8WFC9_9FLAO|nr:DNA mismatch repair protein MutS [Flavivirga aquimarina]MDO5971840.1 DNA mismatch repair protein MutS [Flavivirga aquimarina]